jgi:predicted DNA binding protein
MREFTFAIEYEAGADPVTDVFIDHPETVARSLDGYVTTEQFWRIERVSGPAKALDRIEAVRFDDSRCGESITELDCEARRYHDRLERTDDELVLYTYLEDINACESVHTIAGKHLDPGVVFETRRRNHRHEWRILMRSDASIGVFYDEIGARLRDGLSFRMGSLRDAEGWQQDLLASVAIPAEQRVALRAAVDHGYYETPRGATLDAIAAGLEIPRSTLSYRLRQAETRLVRQYISESSIGE